MVKGKTSSGFEFEVDEESVQDMDLIEALADAEQGHLSGAMAAIRIVLGDKQKEALKRHLKELYGRAKYPDFMTELNEIIEAAPGLKNS